MVRSVFLLQFREEANFALRQASKYYGCVVALEFARRGCFCFAVACATGKADTVRS